MLTYILFVIMLVCLVIILIEYIWLIILSRRRQRQNKFYNYSKAKILDLYESAYNSTTDSGQSEVISEIAKFIGKNNVRMDIITEFIYEKITSEGDEKAAKICSRIFFAINPNKYYTDLLNSGSNYQKAYACKKLSMFNAVGIDSKITSLINTHNLELKYHVIRSLSATGNHNGLVTLFTDELASNFFYSYRVIIEVLDIYTGDRLALVKELLGKCNDYIKSVVIKAAAKYKYTELSDFYVTNLTSKDVNLKIACINALGKLGDPKYEHELIIMANDKDWNVRAVTVKNLVNFNSKLCLDVLKKATSDPNWWVRNNAAKTLVIIDDKLEYTKSILNGYDRFAVETIKYALFKKYKI